MIGIFDKYDEYLRAAGDVQKKSDVQTEDEHPRNAILGSDLRQGLLVNLILGKRFVGLSGAHAGRRLFEAVFLPSVGDRREQKRHLRTAEQEDGEEAPRCDCPSDFCFMNRSCPRMRSGSPQ